MSFFPPQKAKQPKSTRVQPSLIQLKGGKHELYMKWNIKIIMTGFSVIIPILLPRWILPLCTLQLWWPIICAILRWSKLKVSGKSEFFKGYFETLKGYGMKRLLLIISGNYGKKVDFVYNRCQSWVWKYIINVAFIFLIFLKRLETATFLNETFSYNRMKNEKSVFQN